MNPQSQSKGKLYLLDDDPTMVSVLKTLLEIEGYHVVTGQALKSEAEILQTLKTAAPDVVLIDVHLRQINGIDLVRQMKADPTFPPMRTILTSGMAVKEECLKAGADGFLMKPYMPDELMSILKG